jgi:solute carrier family 13 (sodium-dependent dicarboxylate transporter), member 2/3/5
MADLAGTPAVPIAMAVPLATTFVMLVIGCPPTLIAYGFGYFSQWEAFKLLFVRSFIGIIILSLCMAVWYPLVGMPGNIDMMKTPAKLTMSGYELVVPPDQPVVPPDQP